MPNKIDSNTTALAYAEEQSLKTLPGTPVWYPLEPNSYSDFGGQVSLLSRNPINALRKNKKGVITDLDASGEFNQDLTHSNLTRLLQGFFFADIREKVTNLPMNGTAIPFTSVTASTDIYAAASGLAGILANSLVYFTGFTNAANNGLKVVPSASTATQITAPDGTVDETPPATAKAKLVGYQFASGTLNVAMNGQLVQLSRASGAVDFTTLPLNPGDWIFVGGDAVGERFVTNLPGFGRVKRVATTFIELDKVSWTPSAETGTGKTVRIFYCDVLKDESTTNLIKRRTYNIERQLGNDGNGIQSEYLVGAVANELTINIAQADKINVDISFVACDVEQRTGTTGIKSGTRATQTVEDAYNTSSDFSRIKLNLAGDAYTSSTALFAFATEMTVSINNNVNPNKAVGTLGAFDLSVGNFTVSGEMTAYFGDVTAVQAVRNNSDITIDFAIVKANKGLLFDMPLIALGDGRLEVEQDEAITLPLETNAAESTYGHTLFLGSFSYLPDLAA
jgi:hypothetical protein